MLEVQTFTFNAFQENTYVVYTPAKEAIIIDPGCSNSAEERELKEFIYNNALEVQDIVCTHCHIDHVLGLQWASGLFGKKPLIPKGELPVLEAASRVADMYGISYGGTPEVDFLPEGEYSLGNAVMDVLKVPGHSPGHIALYHAPSAMVIAGDVLFHRSIGRTDLPGGDFDTLIRSIRQELFSLPEHTKVYAGHMQPTTIGEEMRYNPFLNQ